ncbi:MAG: hypothetical protein MR966_08450 [Lachnospiraceae bacterium]|nr:hypothetical protein [Lachnospiraceae bacterium]
MSQFGKYLRELLDERRLTISELSRISGVERTSLQKSITGNRILSHDAVEKLIWSLRLTVKESEKLKYYYDIFFVGEDKYRSREIIRRMLENLGSLNSEAVSIGSGFQRVPVYDSDSCPAESKSLITGKRNVNFTIQSVFEREIGKKDAEVQMTVPSDMQFFEEYLFYLYKKAGARVRITQIIAIHRNKAEKKLNLHSIECFANVLPVCLVSDRQYYPYYYYDTSIASLYTDPFPYFVVTGDQVLCLSADGEKALLLGGEAYSRFYRRHFHMLKKQCHALVNYSEGLMSTLDEYERIYDSDHMYVCTHQPCFACEYGDDDIRRKIRKDFPGCQEVTEVCVDWLSRLRNVKMYHSVFKPEGLISFMEEGRIDDFPEIVEEITMEERLELLKSLIDSVESEERTSARMFNDRVFTYPSFITLAASQKTGMGIFTTARFGQGAAPICVHVHEPDVSEAFYDFMLNLPSSEITCSKEETLEYLRKVYQKYAGML